ncbi:MAG: hypothetical protein R3258_01640 [Acidimicrobiia bacterium]|nr:hypothetical protein [Acidimicrobiia bacterium]
MARFDYEGFAEHLLADPNLSMSRAGTVFGEIQGVPAHVGVGTDDSGNAFLAVIVGTRSEEAGEMVKKAWVASDEQLRRSHVEVQPVGALARIPVGKAAKQGFDGLESRVRELARVAASVPNATPSRSPGARAALVNDIPMFLTEAEAGDLRVESSAAAHEYAELRPKYLRGILFGLIGALVSAAVWAAIGFYLDWSGWIIAIGAGLLIGFFTVLGAGKPTRGVQVIIAVMTIVAVVLGDLSVVALVVQEDTGVFDLAISADVYSAVLREDLGFAFFTLGAALVGAWFGSRTGKPVDVETEVELAPPR